LEGRGGETDYQVELSGLEVSGGWGNPAGNDRMDAQAIRGVALHVAGGQGPGEISVYSVRFE
jgi:hypothetical protein